jgi:HSP20 family molecular chaperone IbpA
MLMPSIFGETLLDDFWGFPMRDNYMRTANTNGLMQTDVEERDNGYEITMNLPGFKKEDVKGEIKDGYLTVTATTNTSNDEKDKDGKFIRRERYSGTCSRSFYVGDEVTQNDIKAKFTDGVLKLRVPKKDAKPEVEETKYIAIEG